jgi:hypothetical protein
VAGFDNPLETWNARFAREDFLFGEEPNAFLRTQTPWLLHGDEIAREISRCSQSSVTWCGSYQQSHRAIAGAAREPRKPRRSSQ